jgi:uncharacterized protein YidB (DUF937 family)
MSLLNDVINAALRKHNVPQVGSTGSDSLVDVLRSLLAPQSTEAGTSPHETQAEPDALQQLIRLFERSGYADAIRSWIGTSENRPIQPHELGQALGNDKVDELAQKSGMPRKNLLEELARLLPTVIDGLTPQGRLPESADAHPAKQ